jgi:hypothetical protein
LTYDATLAELTSLEEMMRYMMDDDRIHSDVVNMLWQAYSEHIIILSYHSVLMHPLLQALNDQWRNNNVEGRSSLSACWRLLGGASSRTG